jgi:hypothetical protein
MRSFRVTAYLEVEVSACTPEDAAEQARRRMLPMVASAQVEVSEDDGSAWQTVGHFSRGEVRR